VCSFTEEDVSCWSDVKAPLVDCILGAPEKIFTSRKGMQGNRNPANALRGCKIHQAADLGPQEWMRFPLIINDLLAPSSQVPVFAVKLPSGNPCLQTKELRLSTYWHRRAMFFRSLNGNPTSVARRSRAVTKTMKTILVPAMIKLGAAASLLVNRLTICHGPRRSRASRARNE